MIRKLYRIAALVLALVFAASQAFGQVAFQGYVPHSDEKLAPETKLQTDKGNWYNGEEFEPRVLTLELGQQTEEFIPPQSTLSVQGSGTIPNSDFLRNALGVMGFETPGTPYVLLDNLTHKSLELYAYADLLSFLDTQPNGSIFIIGMDFHSGFIRKDQNGMTFIRSGKNGNGDLIREPIEDSRILKDSQLFIMGDLSEHARIVLGVDAI